MSFETTVPLSRIYSNDLCVKIYYKFEATRVTVGVFYTMQNDNYEMFSNRKAMLIILKWGKKRFKLEAHHSGH